MIRPGISISIREHSHLIVGAPVNDITNIGDIESKEEQLNLAIKSSENCIAIAERALKEFPLLEKVVIPERLPRADYLSDLSEFSNFVLRSLAEKSKMKARIVVAPMKAMYYTNDKELEDIFTSPTSRFDGIHPKGRLSSKLYNECLISAIRKADIGTHRHREQEDKVQGIPTNNMFQGLN